MKLGSELAAIAREFGSVDLDIERDKTPAGTVSFE
jgi:antitoxin FitA